MRITNRSRRTVLAGTVEVATSFWKKSLGLMFRGGISEDAGFLMEFGKPSKDLYSIWMLGMFFPIDVVFISAEKEVTDVYGNVPPLSLNPRTWKVYRPTKPVKWILELKAGRARKSGTVAGDKLRFT
jgi:uncharacterized membrane protein (UPF0127 family)